MTTDLRNLQPGEELGYPSFFRAVFDTVLPKQLVDTQTAALELYAKLYNGIDYVTPLNQPENLPDQSVMVFDLVAFPSAAHINVATFASALNSVKLSTSLVSLERVAKTDVYGDEGVRQRAGVAGVEQQKSDDQSLSQKAADLLGRVGWVLLVILAIVAAVVAVKLYATARAVA